MLATRVSRYLTLQPTTVALAAVAVFVFATRLPYLDLGYGNDVDSWRMANALRLMAQTGQYETSRLPGHPVQEFPYFLIWQGGAFALNLVTALFSVACFLLMALLLQHWNSRDAILGAVTLVFVPLIFVYSTQALDFVWALAFILASVYAVLKRRPALAGLALALAVGCRLTAAAFLLPLGLILWRETEPPGRWRALLWLGLLSTVLGALTYVPVYLRYGPGFLTFYDGPHQDLPVALSYMTRITWGEIGTLVVLAAIPVGWFWRAREASLPGPISNWHIVAWISVVVMHVVLFFRNTDKAAYLMPAIPFVIFLMARYLDRRAFQLACAGLILSAFISINREGIFPGTVFSHWVERQTRITFVKEVLTKGQTLPPESVIVAGWWLPYIEALQAQPAPATPRYVYLLQSEELAAYQRGNVPLYVLPVISGYSAHVYGIDLIERGVTPLWPPGSEPEH